MVAKSQEEDDEENEIEGPDFSGSIVSKAVEEIDGNEESKKKRESNSKEVKKKSKSRNKESKKKPEPPNELFDDFDDQKGPKSKGLYDKDVKSVVSEERKPDAIIKLQYSSNRYHMTMPRKAIEKLFLRKGDEIKCYIDEEEEEIRLIPVREKDGDARVPDHLVE